MVLLRALRRGHASAGVSVDFNILVQRVARAKLDADWLGGMLIEAERTYQAAVAELDAAIRLACRPPAVEIQRPRLRTGRAREASPPPAVLPVVSMRISRPMRDDGHWSLRCGICRTAGHNGRTCPTMKKAQP